MLFNEGFKPIREASLTSRTFAELIAGFAAEKKAGEIVILDMREVVNFCDYFVICSGNTDRQVRAIANGIEEGLEARGIKVKLKKNSGKSDWIVFDAGDVVTHVFEKKARVFYNLEYLWQEAKKIDFVNET